MRRRQVGISRKLEFEQRRFWSDWTIVMEENYVKVHTVSYETGVLMSVSFELDPAYGFSRPSSARLEAVGSSHS